MPSNIERRERFLRVSKKRIKRAVEAIESINSLDGDHYKFENDEIAKIFSSLYASLDYSWLSFKLKNVSNQDKLNFLFEREVAQYENIRKRDPVFYAEIKKNLPELLVNFIEKKEGSISKEDSKNIEVNLNEKLNKIAEDTKTLKKELGSLTLWLRKNDD